jgi:hypothetical protein
MKGRWWPWPRKPRCLACGSTRRLELGGVTLCAGCARVVAVITACLAEEAATIRLGDRGRSPRCLEHPAQRGERHP